MILVTRINSLLNPKSYHFEFLWPFKDFTSFMITSELAEEQEYIVGDIIWKSIAYHVMKG